MSCDVDEATESLEEEALLILQHFHRSIYVTAHSPRPIFSIASPMSQLILQPFCRISISIVAAVEHGGSYSSSS